MSNWSIKRKLTFLCVALLALLVAISAESLYGIIRLSGKLDDISHTQLPAVRSMGTVDMMHDGLRAVVFRSIFLSETADETGKKEVTQELEEMTSRIKAELEEIARLPITPATRAAIEKVRPEVDAYVKAAIEVTKLAVSGSRADAVARLPEVQKEYEILEKDLGELGELIAADAAKSDAEGVEIASRVTLITSLLVLAGLIGGTILALLLVRGLMRTLSQIIDRLRVSSRELTGASSQSASSATELSEASTEQAASLQQTMASVEEISAMVSQNAETAGKVRAAVDANQRATEDGTESVIEMSRAIQEIKETNDKILGQMENSNAEFGAIVKIITEIGEKTKVINDIVFQTKLLSFNASVEAARAGEHGKGFAVVAEEVGNLAQMSGNAAKQITEMLTDSVRKVNGIVEQTTQRVDQLVEIGKDKITMGESTVEKCRTALEKIAENARTVTSMVAEITNASKEQAQGIQEINKAIAQLDQVTQQNTAVAHQSSAQAEQLNKEAESLSSAVDLLTHLVGLTRADGDRAAPTGGGGNVISLHQRRQAKNSLRAASPSRPALKQAAGSGLVPSSTDPGFEEF